MQDKKGNLYALMITMWPKLRIITNSILNLRFTKEKKKAKSHFYCLATHKIQ